MEQVATFGPQGTLVGVFSPGKGGGDLCCLLMNAGVIHRIGPHRLNVKLARGLAQESVASLRFDLSGLGDSPPPAGAASYDEQSVKDLRDAMDFAQAQFGQRRFVIFGICSGAVNAQRAALADHRVVGIFMLDGFWYRTRWTRLAMMWARLRAHSPRTLLRSIARKFTGRGADTTTASGPPKKVEIFSTDGTGNPPAAQFAEEMDRLTTRGVAAYFLYSGSVDDLVSYRRQLAHAFPGASFVKKVRVERRVDLDHTAVSQHSQREIVALVRAWVRKIDSRGARS